MPRTSLPRLASWLTAALAGCSLATGGTAVTPLDDGGLSDGAATGSPTADTGTGLGEAGSMDATAEATVDTGPPGCDLGGKYALKLTATASWEAKMLANIVTVIEGGMGDLEMLVLSEFDRDGNVLEGSIRVCDVHVPSFESTIVGERYGVVFDEAMWESDSMPTFPSRIELDCPEAGCALQIPPVSVLLGVSMNNPRAPWPPERAALTYPDHDGDGFEGVTLQALGPAAGNSHQYPPTSYDLIFPQRANELMLGIRVNAALEGQLDTCTSLSGEATTLTIDTHANTCRLANTGTECSTEQSGFVDGNLPQWDILDATFESVALMDDAAGCEEARAAF